MTAPFPFDVATMLPHGRHERFVTEVVESGDDAVVCVARVPAESPFTRDGVVPGFVLTEVAAQAAAIDVLAGTGAGRLRPRMGYLVRARRLSWTAEGVPAGTPLTARVEREDSIPPLYTYRATVTSGGIDVFSGEFSIYVEQEAD